MQQDMIKEANVNLFVAKIVKELRAKSGLNKKMFAERLGVNPSYISNLEAGRKNVRLRTLNKYAQILNQKINIGEPKDTTNKNFLDIATQHINSLENENQRLQIENQDLKKQIKKVSHIRADTHPDILRLLSKANDRVLELARELLVYGTLSPEEIAERELAEDSAVKIAKTLNFND